MDFGGEKDAAYSFLFNGPEDKKQEFMKCVEHLSSGISPVRRYLDEGLHIGLGSDIAGGTSVSILRAMADAIQVSKLYWRLVDSSMKPLTVEEEIGRAHV